MEAKHLLSELKLRPPKKPSFSASCEAAPILLRVRRGWSHDLQRFSDNVRTNGNPESNGNVKGARLKRKSRRPLQIQKQLQRRASCRGGWASDFAAGVSWLKPRPTEILGQRQNRWQS